MIKNLIFDFGRVLIDSDFQRIIRQFFDDEQKTMDFMHTILTQEWTMKRDIELQPFADTIHDMQKAYPHYRNEIQLFGDRYTEFAKQEMPGMRELLTQLKSNGYKLYGLSNWCSKIHITMQQFPIFQLLDGSIISSEVHMVKPNPDIYHCLFNTFSLQPSECLFADDKLLNIEAGQSLDMPGILFQNTAQYRSELLNYGITIS